MVIARKSLKGDFGEVEINVPRDRSSDFSPKIVPKHESRFDGFDDKILSIVCSWHDRSGNTGPFRGDIPGRSIPDVDIQRHQRGDGPKLKSGRRGPSMKYIQLSTLMPFEARCVMMGQIKNKAVYLALGINMSGHKELLGLWIAENEGAKFWLGIMTRTEEPRCKRYFYRVCGWVKRLSRSD